MGGTDSAQVAATGDSTPMDDVTATVVAAHPSPLVAAAYQGRGSYTFVRGGGRGRGGRFLGRGGFGGRADVKSLIASKTWVRTKPGTETTTEDVTSSSAATDGGNGGGGTNEG
jgi:hypothetical protein